MALTLNQIVAICADTVFQKQCQAAAVSYALNTAIKAAPTAFNTADSAKWLLAQTTIQDGCTANLQRFVWAVANSGAGTFVLNDTTDTNDALIASAIVTLWPEIALVTAGMETGQ